MWKMMKFSVFTAALLAGSASAFAPAQHGRLSTAVNAERSQALPFMNRPPLLDGSMAGDRGFDPLGLSNINDVGIDLYWLREAEIKHCRLSMLAFLGFVWVEIFGPAPGCEMATAKNQMDAFWQLWNAHPQYIVAGLIGIMFVESITGIAITTGRESGMREPGYFGFDPLGFSKDPKAAADLKEKEISNGRLAMWASAGCIMQGVTTDDGAIGNLFN
jgi:light-harvesting complex I chlorophyll a/b binding protein 1